MDENFILKQIDNYINIYYLLTFVFLSYLIKRYFKVIIDTLFNMFLYFCKKYIFQQNVHEWTNKETPMVHVVMIIAALIAIPYLLAGATWFQILLSYAVGTSLHEVMFSFIEKKLFSCEKKKF